ncbi:diguanylate cyclase domain-containing protein [Sandaracinus amylolyticus]|uniref:sensor domain-containing diguanylate cyclase n=1 Tax=Sandaracinus amylolyticus TaxID=927083 RepID=UPI001F2D5B20|nr:diguanylate cyclase [Sandaracinus amylolyticus]UJR78444.1 GGDEF domain-containing protein [Sandaracinus amylolyticus]
MIDAKVTLHVLIDLHRALVNETSLEKQLDRVARAALALLEAEHASIRVLDETGTELLSGARAGTGVQYRPVTFGRGVGVAGWVVDHNETVRIDDVSSDPRFVDVRGQGFAIQSMLAVPLSISGVVIGVLVVTSERLGAFDASKEDLAILLASIAVSPIERARLEEIALRDPSTRAFGARYLAPRLAGEVHRAREGRVALSVIALDLDPLPELREELGRAAIDALLRVAVDRILAVVRARGVVIRRDAGELVIVLPQYDADDAERMADRIGEALGKPVTELGAGLEVLELTASSGVVQWDGAESPTRLERRADDALRAAKQRGPGAIAVWPSGERALEG